VQQRAWDLFRAGCRALQPRCSASATGPGPHTNSRSALRRVRHYGPPPPWITLARMASAVCRDFAHADESPPYCRAPQFPAARFVTVVDYAGAHASLGPPGIFHAYVEVLCLRPCICFDPNRIFLPSPLNQPTTLLTASPLALGENSRLESPSTRCRPNIPFSTLRVGNPSVARARHRRPRSRLPVHETAPRKHFKRGGNTRSSRVGRGRSHAAKKRPTPSRADPRALVPTLEVADLEFDGGPGSSRRDRPKPPCGW